MDDGEKGERDGETVRGASCHSLCLPAKREPSEGRKAREPGEGGRRGKTRAPDTRRVGTQAPRTRGEGKVARTECLALVP
jgi:hypothetical protein